MKNLMLLVLVLVLATTGCVASGKGGSSITVGNIEMTYGTEGSVVWLWPTSFYTHIEQSPVDNSATVFEFPGIYPTLSRIVGISYQSGTMGSKTVSQYGLNPIVGWKQNRVLVDGINAWEFTLGKGLLGFGHTRKGGYTQLFWLIHIGNGQEAITDLRTSFIFHMKE